MTTTTTKGKTPTFIVILGIVVGIYLLYVIVVAMAKICIYLGYNFFFYTDNMLKVQAISPMVSWGILGLFAGSIAGVIVGIKKFKLSWLLVLYPFGIAALFITVLILINKPGLYTGELKLPDAAATATQTADSISGAGTLKYFYIATTDVNTHISPTLSSQKSFTIKRGAEVEVIERRLYDARNIEWLKIKYNYQEAYVSLKYLKFSRSGY